MHLLHGSDRPTHGISPASSGKDSPGGADVRISVRVKSANQARPEQRSASANGEPGLLPGAAAPKRISGTLKVRPAVTARRRHLGTGSTQ